MPRGPLVFLLVLPLLPAADATRQPPAEGYRGWPAFGGGKDNIHYSNIASITAANVATLKPAWTLDTGDAFKGSEMQCNPIVIGGIAYLTTPKLRVLAVEAATGRLVWSFNPFDGENMKWGFGFRNRGVAHWSDGKQSRIFVAASHWLYSLDRNTGRPDPAFGANGRVDLREGLGREKEGITVNATTPGVVFRDLYITGTLVSEGLPAAPGDIRAYDVRTGKVRWQFHTIPKPGEFGAETWPVNARDYLGGANNWAGMALDEKRGIVYVPTGSAAFDFYGANRRGDNLFANTLLALRAATGKRVWHFQAVKHDVWDRDFPSAPALVTVKKEGKLIDAVAQTSKSGHIWLFDRDKGRPVYPLQTLNTPPSDVDGELLASTQVLPTLPPPVARQQLTEELLTNRTPEARQIVLERFRTLRSGPQFTPPGREGTIIFPGFDGGAEWGGAAFDPETGLFYVNSNEMAWVLRLVPRKPAVGTVNGARLYQANCAACHRDDLGGSPPQFPSLLDLGVRYDDAKMRELLRQGVGRMPGFKQLGDESLGAIARFVLRRENTQVQAAAEDPRIAQKYAMDGYNKFLDPDGYPAIAPPWGTLNAVNLDTGKIEWKIPFGEHPELAAQGMKDTGSENYGGGIVTRGGLFFIAATNNDRKLRAYDKRTGKLLWETLLPFSGNATPALVEIQGKPYLIVGCGGGKSGAESGGVYVAYTLPD